MKVQVRKHEVKFLSTCHRIRNIQMKICWSVSLWVSAVHEPGGRVLLWFISVSLIFPVGFNTLCRTLQSEAVQLSYQMGTLLVSMFSILLLWHLRIKWGKCASSEVLSRSGGGCMLGPSYVCRDMLPQEIAALDNFFKRVWVGCFLLNSVITSLVLSKFSPSESCATMFISLFFSQQIFFLF